MGKKQEEKKVRKILIFAAVFLYSINNKVRENMKKKNIYIIVATLFCLGILKSQQEYLDHDYIAKKVQEGYVDRPYIEAFRQRMPNFLFYIDTNNMGALENEFGMESDLSFLNGALIFKRHNSIMRPMILSFLLRKKVSINKPNKKGNYPIHEAIEVHRDPHPDNVEAIFGYFFIHPQFDPNVKNSTGNTPLHMAVNTGNSVLVKKLIDAGAKKDIKNGMRETPYDLVLNKLKEAGSKKDNAKIRLYNDMIKLFPIQFSKVKSAAKRG